MVRDKVNIWSMDSWSGRDLVKTENFFGDAAQAADYAKWFNSYPRAAVVPEYYEYAETTI